MLCPVLLAFLAILFAEPLSSQDEPVFVRVYYIDALPDKSSEYLELVLDEGVKIAQARADAGQIAAWYFMAARVPSGERANADFLAVYVMQDGFDSPSVTLADAIEKAGLKMSADEYREKRGSLTDLLYNDIWRNVAQVSESEVGNFILINYMDVHNMSDWLEIESDLARPTMEAQVNDGILTAWGSYRLYLPRGTALPYNAGTVDVFADWSAVGRGSQFADYLEKVKPGMDMDQVREKIGKSRDIVRSDLYEILAKVTPSE